jgi:hypothetical protein
VTSKPEQILSAQVWVDTLTGGTQENEQSTRTTMVVRVNGKSRVG